MTAFIFTPDHIALIQRGLKTHTLRIAKPGEEIGFCGNGVQCVYLPSDRVKWCVGGRCAIKPGRTAKASGYVIVTGIREMMLCEVDDEMARAEGAEDRAEFIAVWESIHGTGSFEKNPRCWGISFWWHGESR